MANSLREVKEKISATKSTMQITKAMNLVSQAKVRKAQQAYREYISYLEDLKRLIGLMLNKVDSVYQNRYLSNSDLNENVLYILVTSDRGLAGPYNANIYKKFKELTINTNSQNIYTASLGRMGFTFLRRNHYNMILNNPVHVRDDLMFIDIDPLFKMLNTSFLEKKLFDKVYVIYNHFVNSLNIEVKVEQIIPLDLPNITADTKGNEYNYELGIQRTLDQIIPIYIEDLLFGIVLDAKAAEHMSRMNAMKSATDNATEIIGKLDLLYNRARQASITNELIDIINGSQVGGE